MEDEILRLEKELSQAVVTALTTTKGKCSGQDFTTKERATDVFVKQDGRWRCAVSHLTSFTKK